MILPGQIVRAHGLVTPCEPRTTHGGASYGLGPGGYDVRVAQPVNLAPGEFCLASTMERFNMPTDVMGIVHDKSTWARLGLAVQNTVLEAGWRGYLTLELTNHGPSELNLPPGVGIAQVVFHRMETYAALPYDGKYQDQEAGPQRARFTLDDEGR